MKNVLITGGAGFIGSNLALELEKKGHDVVVLDDYSSASIQNLRGFRGDIFIGDESGLEECGSAFDVIFHQAAITDTTFRDDREMLRKNVDGFRKVLQFAMRKNAVLVYASSAGTYGNGKAPMRESQEPQPLNAYAYSKYFMDNLAKKHAKDLKVVGVRYFNVFGPGEKHKGKSASMVYQLYRQMAAGRNPRIFKYGEQVRDHVYVKDVVAATIRAADAKESGVFNVGTGEATTFNQIIDHLNKAMKASFRPEYFDNPYTDVYQVNTRADISRIGKALGWKPRFSTRTGIADYVAWLKAQGE
ncbi:TPA: ADP-glyceromanno-heptose 6-epimerase [Candidatus Woesearchaeota archaeon]|nr:ADP-glyceromanno-heptose 6-epimerase [Candidatus Woesearchaeota archaeon]